MSFPRVTGWSMVALAIVLAGCTGVTATRVAYDGSSNPRYVLTYLASHGPDVRTVVIAPEGEDAAAWGQAVTGAMNAHRVGPPVNYTVTPTAEASPGYRVVMVFGTGPMLGDRVCREEVASGGVRPALQAVFCYRERSVSEGFFEVPALTGHDDPALDALVGAAMARLFPLQIPPANNDDCPFGAFC